jgi:hypothetical protein
LIRGKIVDKNVVNRLEFETNPKIVEEPKESLKVPKLDISVAKSALENARRNKKLKRAEKENLDKFVKECDLGIDNQLLKSNRFSNNGSNLLIPLKNSENLMNSIKKEMKTLRSISRHLASHSGNKNTSRM